MLKSDVDAFIDTWPISTKYVFKSFNYFSYDLIVLKRIDEENFESCRNSTVSISGLTKNEVIKLIGMNLFIYEAFIDTEADLHEHRAGGCTCGAARSNNPDKHAFHCKKYKKD